MPTIHPKVIAFGTAGAITIIVVWIATLFGLAVPAEVASAFTVLVGSIAGYIKKVPGNEPPQA